MRIFCLPCLLFRFGIPALAAQPCRIEVLTHENYTFYNVQIDWQLTSPEEPILLFEGTYTTAFSDNKSKTPRYDYNQMLYRLDLDDPALSPAQRDGQRVGCQTPRNGP